MTCRSWSTSSRLGKTDAVVLAWLWRRRFLGRKKHDATPRKLVYCLPMGMQKVVDFRKDIHYGEN